MSWDKIEAWEKKQFYIFIGVYVSMLAFALIVGGVGPDPIHTQTTYAYGCKDKNGKPEHHNLACLGGYAMQNPASKWPIYVNDVSSLNRFFVVTLGVYNNENAFFSLEKNLDVTVTLNTNETGTYKPVRTYTSSHKLDCPSKQDQCKNVTIFFEEFLYQHDYRLDVTFTNVVNQSHSWVGDVQATAITMSTAYSQFVLGWRISLLLVNIGLLVAFLYAARKQGMRNFGDWSYDQKAAFGLLVALIAFCDPFYMFTYAAPGVFVSVLSSIFETVFVGVILLYWMIVLDKLRVDELRVQIRRFYGPKVLLVSLLCIFLFVGSMWVIAGASVDPIPSRTNVVAEGARALFGISFVILLVIWGYLGYLTYQCMLVVRMKPELRNRFAYLGLPAVGFFLMFVIFIFIRIAGTNDFAVNFFFNLWMSNVYVWTVVYAMWPDDASSLSYSRQDDETAVVGGGDLDDEEN